MSSNSRFHDLHITLGELTGKGLRIAKAGLYESFPLYEEIIIEETQINEITDKGVFICRHESYSHASSNPGQGAASFITELYTRSPEYVSCCWGHRSC
jgi:hypothetical protein